jgi:hypothetical protein
MSLLVRIEKMSHLVRIHLFVILSLWLLFLYYQKVDYSKIWVAILKEISLNLKKTIRVGKLIATCSFIEMNELLLVIWEFIGVEVFSQQISWLPTLIIRGWVEWWTQGGVARLLAVLARHEKDCELLVGHQARRNNALKDHQLSRGIFNYLPSLCMAPLHLLTLHVLLQICHHKQ